MIDAIVAGVPSSTRTRMHTPCPGGGGQAETVAHLISKRSSRWRPPGRPLRQGHVNTTSYQMAIRNRHMRCWRTIVPGAQDLEVTRSSEPRQWRSRGNLHLAALRGEVHTQEHLDSAKAKAENNAAAATVRAPINKLIPVEANEGKDALRLHKALKEGEGHARARQEARQRRGDPEANNPAQGNPRDAAARQRGGYRAAARALRHRRAYAQGRHRSRSRRRRPARSSPPSSSTRAPT